MIRRPPRSTPLYSSAASDVYKRQLLLTIKDFCFFSKDGTPWCFTTGLKEQFESIKDIKYIIFAPNTSMVEHKVVPI